MTILLRPKGPSEVCTVEAMVRQASIFRSTAASSASYLVVEMSVSLGCKENMVIEYGCAYVW